MGDVVNLDQGADWCGGEPNPIICRKELKTRLTGYLDFLMNEQKLAAKAS